MEAQDRIDELTKRQMDQADEANERQKGVRNTDGRIFGLLEKYS